MSIKTLDDITVTACIDRVLKHEGGYVNDPVDNGGETNRGITKTTAIRHKHIWSKHNWDGNMRTLPLSFAYDVYKMSYWDASGCNELYRVHPVLSYHVFDWSVNGGVGRAVKDLQSALNTLNLGGKLYPDIAVDGVFGKGTLGALNSYIDKRGKDGVRVLLCLLIAKQASFYEALSVKNPSQEKYMHCWLINRVWSKLADCVPLIK